MTKILAEDSDFCPTCGKSISEEQSFCSSECEQIFGDAMKQMDNESAEALHAELLEHQKLAAENPDDLSFYGETVSRADLIRYFGM